MYYVTAIAICECAQDHGEDEVLAAVEKILSMETINAVPKVALLNVVRWFWDRCVMEETT